LGVVGASNAERGRGNVLFTSKGRVRQAIGYTAHADFGANDDFGLAAWNHHPGAAAMPNDRTVLPRLGRITTSVVVRNRTVGSGVREAGHILGPIRDANAHVV